MRRHQLGLLVIAAAALFAAGMVRPIRAQDAGAGGGGDDLKRGVARISLMDGQVSVRRGDSGEWVAGIINAPLMADDYIATAPNSRAEVQFDASQMIRLGGSGEIHLTALENGHYQFELAKGTLTYRILRPSGANAEVDTPAVSIRPSKPGSYRISVGESGETEVTARAGDIEIYTPRGSQWVNAGQTMMARGNPSDPEFQIVSAIPMDDWDRWNADRDRVFLQASPSAQYIDPGNSGIYGTEELDNNGTWVNTPDYGYVWHPTAVDPGWAPYSVGRWVWEDWYGWTWVSYDPWGWAPYHYGRWFYASRWGWCWYPGRFGYRSYWSPALVAWFGYGGGVGFGFGFGNVGWVPLAPFEVFHPWWGRGFYGRSGFERNINITNVNITNVYRNARVANGVSGMAAADFQRGHFGAIGRVSAGQVSSAGLVRGQMPIGPTNSNLQFSNRQASFTPQVASGQRFFTHQSVSTPQRIPFAQQQRAMGVTPSATPGGRQFGSPSQSPAGRQTLGPETNTRPGGAAGGWRRFGEPAASNATQAAPRNDANSFRGQSPAREITRPQAQGGSGWQRFGNPGSGQAAPRAQDSSPGYSAPRYSAPRYSAPPSYSAPRSAPSYNAPRSAPAPSYSAPRSAPSYSAPRSAPAPSYSAPRGGGGGGGGSRPSGGGGGGHSNGGGGHHR